MSDFEDYLKRNATPRPAPRGEPRAKPEKVCICGHPESFHVPFPACGDLGWYGCIGCAGYDPRCKLFIAAPAPSDTPEPRGIPCGTDLSRFDGFEEERPAAFSSVPAEEPTSYGIIEVIRDMNDEITKMIADPKRGAGLSTVTYWRDLIGAHLAKGLTERSAITKQIVADLEGARHVSGETLNLRVQAAASPDRAEPPHVLDVGHGATCVCTDCITKRHLHAEPELEKLLTELANGKVGYDGLQVKKEAADSIRHLFAQRGAPVCDCGEKLTQCSDCAVADYQAAHTDCPTCCPQSSERGAPRPLVTEAIEMLRTLAKGERGSAEVGEPGYSEQFADEIDDLANRLSSESLKEEK